MKALVERKDERSNGFSSAGTIEVEPTIRIHIVIVVSKSVL